MYKEFIELTEEERMELIQSLIITHKELGGSVKDISDEWHTFRELYYHRMILFLALQQTNHSKAWKSKRHFEGDMFDDSFIVGIETTEGNYTYHYKLEYWDVFKNIKELERAPKWDGHKPKDITRLLSIA